MVNCCSLCGHAATRGTLVSVHKARPEWDIYFAEYCPFKAKKCTFLCSQHFEPESFENGGPRRAGYASRLQLKKDAMPTMPFQKKVLQSTDMVISSTRWPQSSIVGASSVQALSHIEVNTTAKLSEKCVFTGSQPVIGSKRSVQLSPHINVNNVVQRPSRDLGKMIAVSDSHPQIGGEAAVQLLAHDKANNVPQRSVRDSGKMIAVSDCQPASQLVHQGMDVAMIDKSCEYRSTRLTDQHQCCDEDTHDDHNTAIEDLPQAEIVSRDTKHPSEVQKKPRTMLFQNSLQLVKTSDVRKRPAGASLLESASKRPRHESPIQFTNQDASSKGNHKSQFNPDANDKFLEAVSSLECRNTQEICACNYSYGDSSGNSGKVFEEHNFLCTRSEYVTKASHENSYQLKEGCAKTLDLRTDALPTKPLSKTGFQPANQLVPTRLEVTSAVVLPHADSADMPTNYKLSDVIELQSTHNQLIPTNSPALIIPQDPPDGQEDFLKGLQDLEFLHSVFIPEID